MPAFETQNDRLDARDSFSPQLTDLGVRAQMAVERMTSQGIPYSNAVGIVGNFLKETPTLNPLQEEGIGINTPPEWGTTVSDMTVPPTGGYSLSQTTARSRKAELSNFLKERPQDMSAFLAAVDFTVKEIKETPYYRALATTPMSVADASEFATVKYETPQKVIDGGFAKSKEIQERQMLSSMLDKQLGGPLGGGPFSGISQSLVDWAGHRIDGMEIGDFGPPVWNGPDLTTLAAPVGAVSYGGDLPDIETSPTIASDSTGFGFSPSFASPDFVDRGFQSVAPSAGWAGDGGFQAATPEGGWAGDGGFHNAPSSSPSFSPDVGPFGFSGMQPSASQNALGLELSAQYGATPPSFASPSFDMSTNTGWAVDKDTSPAYGTIASDTTGTGQSFNQPTVPSFSKASPTTRAAHEAPAPAKSRGPAPTEYGMGLPENFNFGMPKAPAGFPELPPEVPPPDFAVPKAHAPKVAPLPPPVTVAPAPKVAAPRPVAAPPRPIAPPKAPPSFSRPAPAPAAPSAPAAAVDFSTAFNSLWAPKSAAANRQSFSDMTGMNAATVNALTSAYDSGGMLTGVAYSGLMDAFNNPSFAQPAPAARPASPSIDFAANAVQPVFAAPIADLSNLVNNPGGLNLDSQGGIVGSYTAGGGLYGGSIFDRPEMASFGWGGFGGFGNDGTNPGLR